MPIVVIVVLNLLKRSSIEHSIVGGSDECHRGMKLAKRKRKSTAKPPPKAKRPPTVRRRRKSLVHCQF